MTDTHTHFREVTHAVTQNLAGLREEVPDLMKAFGDLGKAANRDGALSAKTKELIAVALGVAVPGDACIGFHVRSLVRLGATRKELAEALGMAVYMGGGPSLMYAASALAAMDEFTAAAAKPVAAA